MVARGDVSFAQQIAIDRQHNEYDYGGNWGPFDRTVGTDCSGCVDDECDAALNGTKMAWQRAGSTEDWRPPSMGGNANPSNGPFGAVMVNDPSEFPGDAAVLIALHHGPGGGENSHVWCQVDKLKIETHGSDSQFPNGATVLNDGVNFHDDVRDVHTIDSPSQYGANNWWYIRGPITEDGTPVPTGPSPLPGEASATTEPTPATATDTLFADVSEFQSAVDDTYPYKVLSIRVCDGTYQDHNFPQNYAWMRKALDSGQLTFGILYTYVRPSEWASNGQTMMAMIDANGGLHPRCALMLDVESGGNPSGDQSIPINNLYNLLGQYAGGVARVIGYANAYDFSNMWRTKPPGVRVVGAGYGSNPNLPGQVAHQYTDGSGYSADLPQGCPPFGTCDMNSADGLDPDAFALACGIQPVTPDQPTTPSTPGPLMALTDDEQTELLTKVRDVWDQLRIVWPQIDNHTLVDGLAAAGHHLGVPGFAAP